MVRLAQSTFLKRQPCVSNLVRGAFKRIRTVKSACRLDLEEIFAHGDFTLPCSAYPSVVREWGHLINQMPTSASEWIPNLKGTYPV